MEYKNLFKELEIIEKAWEDTHMSLKVYNIAKNEIIDFYIETYRNEKEVTND